MKFDPYNHEGSLTRWKDKVRDFGGIPDISRENSDLILSYLKDMELGINTSLSSKKGARSFTRLNTIRLRLTFLSRKFKELLDIDDFTKVTEQQLCQFFTDMRKGIIKRQDRRRYKATRDFVKIFKAFWHWHQKVARKAGKEIIDITIYLDSSGDSISIKRGQLHRISAIEDTKILEISYGVFDEEDIERIEDDFNRVDTTAI